MSDTNDRLRLLPNRKCPICNGIDRELLFQQHFSTLSIGVLLDGYNVVTCRDCGFCFADNIPAQSAFDTYYREMSKYEQENRSGSESKFDLARFNAIVSFIQPFLPDIKSRILEIGCSTGLLLSILKQYGYNNIWGVDPSPACSRVAEKVYGIRVLTTTLSDLVVESKSVDFLILVGVLEHVRELGETLRMLWNILSDNGQIFLAVPDASRYAYGQDAPYQEFSLEHINFFGPHSLNNLLFNNSFKLVEFEQDLVEANYHTFTPAIHAVYQKNESPISIVPDRQTEKGLVEYINRSQEADEHIQFIIAGIVSANQPIVVWGTGTHTLRLLANTPLAKANIRAFVDSNPRYQGKSLHGIPIVSPIDLDKNSGAILISSRVYQHEIEAQIRNELRLVNQVITLYPMD